MGHLPNNFGQASYQDKPKGTFHDMMVSSTRATEDFGGHLPLISLSLSLSIPERCKPVEAELELEPNSPEFQPRALFNIPCYLLKQTFVHIAMRVIQTNTVMTAC
jgi:hypothetical protein